MLPIVIIGSGIAGAGLAVLGKKLAARRRKKQQQKESQESDSSTALVVEKTQTELEKESAEHYFKTASASFVLAGLGSVFYTPLLVPAVSLVVYSSLPVFKSAWDNLTQGRVRANLVESIAIVGGIVTQYYVASGLVAMVYFAAVKINVRTEDQSKKELSNIFGQTPRSVWLLKNGVEIETPFEEIALGDHIVIHAGELIPIDGKIIEGYASVDQHAMTGESQPIPKEMGDSVLAGTVAIEGKIIIEIEKCGQDTVAAQIGEILQNTADFRSSVEAKSLKLSDRIALPTLMAGGATLATLGPVSGVALISCNFSEVIRLVAPISVLNHLKLATEQGILIKDGRALELLNQVDTIVFDKTGTLTIEQPHVQALHPWNNTDPDTLLQFTATAEYKQSHPIARAILEYAEQKNIELASIDDAKYEIGYGIKVDVNQQTVVVGSLYFMEMQGIELPHEHAALQQRCQEHGHSLIYTAVDGVALGAIELHSTIRPEAKDVIQALKTRDKKLCIISGDQKKPTQYLADQLGIDDYFAETLPENKAEIIKELQAQGRSVCFVGDGINDAIALKQANVSVSLQGASSVAMDTAGIILMDKGIHKLPHLFELAEDLDKNMKRSVVSALVPGVFGATGVLLLGFGIYASFILYTISLAAGTTNSMLPLLNKKLTDKQE